MLSTLYRDKPGSCSVLLGYNQERSKHFGCNKYTVSNYVPLPPSVHTSVHASTKMQTVVARLISVSGQFTSHQVTKTETLLWSLKYKLSVMALITTSRIHARDLSSQKCLSLFPLLPFSFVTNIYADFFRPKVLEELVVIGVQERCQRCFSLL